MRGATAGLRGDVRCIRISIHAPHEGCDRDEAMQRVVFRDFNPRTP